MTKSTYKKSSIPKYKLQNDRVEEAKYVKNEVKVTNSDIIEHIPRRIKGENQSLNNQLKQIMEKNLKQVI